MSQTLTTRRMSSEDIPEVVELMRLSLGETSLLVRSSDLFRWKHLLNPFGSSIALVAVSGDQIVGLRTFMRWQLTTGEGDIVRCVRAVDTATHPQHQRRGIFRRLTEEALEIARREDVDLVFNTPNKKSKPGYLKMGWKEVGPIGAMARPSWRLLSPPKEPALTLADAAPIDADWIEDIEDRSANGLRTPRTPGYLQWRYGSHPTARYQLARCGAGSAVVRGNLRRGRSELAVVEVFGDPSHALKAAVRASRAQYVGTWFSPGSPERSSAFRRGFVTVPRLRALNLVMRPLKQLPDRWQDLEAWDTAVGDFELL